MQEIFVTILLALPAIGAYAINAIGIVVVYRASKVLNLAHGGMTMLAAYAAYQFVEWNLPRPIGLLGGIVVSVALALFVERYFVRRLRAGGPTAQTIGTVAALTLMVAVAGRYWGTTPRLSVPVFPEKGFEVANTVITVGQIGLFLSMLVIAALLYAILQRTYLGLVLRGTAENRTAASLMGADPDRMTQLAWAIGGAMAGIAGEMLAAVGSLHPYNLALAALPAYVAALIGGMNSLPAAVGGAAVVGLMQGLIPLLGPLERLEGNTQLAIAVVALMVMASRGARFAGVGGGEAALETQRSTDTRARRRWIIVAGTALALSPWFVSFSLLGNLNTAAIYAIVAVALVLLTGWVGQISLAHAAFAGVGAFMTGIFTNSLNIPFPLNLPLSAAAAGAAAALLGVVALRVRGLYLAVATLIFAWVAEQFLFRQSWLTSEAFVTPELLGREGGFPPFIDLSNRRVFFYVAWATVLLVVFLAANLRDTKIGRAFFAVRGSEIAAASLGIDVTRFKLLAFVLSGTIAGIAGNLMMLQSNGVTPDQFEVTDSLFFLAVLVVGGVESLGGAIAAALLFGGIEEMFFRFEALSEYVEVASAVLLAVVLLAYRRGLAGVPDSLARAWARLGGVGERASGVGDVIDRIIGRVQATLRTAGRMADERIVAATRLVLRRKAAEDAESARAPEAVEAPVIEVSTQSKVAVTAETAPERPALPKDRTERAPLLEAEEITVVFGGLTAADAVNVRVYEGEIVGLIGPNGAGKTTTFNAIAGLNEPTRGRVKLFGQDVTGLPVHKRAGFGVGRTFQLIQLFPQLSVFENMLVATHLANPSGVLSGAIAGSKALMAEAKARRRVRDVIEMLHLGEFADRPTGGLPFGVLRMVEVGRAMVTDPRLIMLDEPASGLDNTETDRLSELLLNVRELGVGLLLIEHDVRMVTSVSDYMYVIDRGTPLADGTPDKIQRDPNVIAAYLGQPADEADGTAKPKRGAKGAPKKPATKTPPAKKPAARKSPARKPAAKKREPKEAAAGATSATSADGATRKQAPGPEAPKHEPMEATPR